LSSRSKYATDRYEQRYAPLRWQCLALCILTAVDLVRCLRFAYFRAPEDDVSSAASTITVGTNTPRQLIKKDDVVGSVGFSILIVLLSVVPATVSLGIMLWSRTHRLKLSGLVATSISGMVSFVFDLVFILISQRNVSALEITFMIILKMTIMSVSMFGMFTIIDMPHEFGADEEEEAANTNDRSSISWLETIVSFIPLWGPVMAMFVSTRANRHR